MVSTKLRRFSVEAARSSLIEPRTLDTESLLPLQYVKYRLENAKLQNEPHAGELVVDGELTAPLSTDHGVDR